MYKHNYDPFSDIQHRGLLTSAVVQSDYSYFDPSTFSTWAGIQHWKMRIPPKNENKGTCTHVCHWHV